jgi:hypothetical protein
MKVFSQGCYTSLSYIESTLTTFRGAVSTDWLPFENKKIKGGFNWLGAPLTNKACGMPQSISKLESTDIFLQNKLAAENRIIIIINGLGWIPERKRKKEKRKTIIVIIIIINCSTLHTSGHHPPLQLNPLQ